MLIKKLTKNYDYLKRNFVESTAKFYCWIVFGCFLAMTLF